MAENNIGAVVVDGKIQKSTASSNSLSTDKTTGKTNSLDKDAFLQLLVAQMKYQDPLEPTSNTEYVSQLATFSQLEEMQNMTSGMTLQRASSLVGQEVTCKITNANTGNTEMVSGIVDYVVYENKKAYVSINESLYSVDDIYQVIDPEYSEAYALAKKFVEALSSFPKVDDLTLKYEESLTTLRKTYDEMNNYQKTFIAKDVVKILEDYEAKMKELKLAKEAEDKANGTTDDGTKTDKGTETNGDASGTNGNSDNETT